MIFFDEEKMEYTTDEPELSTEWLELWKIHMEGSIKKLIWWNDLTEVDFESERYKEHIKKYPHEARHNN